ncbi:MAG: vanadium-dependent haloperoxidase [Saprospiraceae bacterium]|nr:vanadium-dependent haloperoxidase [Saprospiraceae bacterium]
MNKLLFIILITALGACTHKEQSATIDETFIHYCTDKLLDITMEDIYSPPVASRVFVYPYITCYEVMENGSGRSFMKYISKEWNPKPDFDTSGISYPLAALKSFCIVAKGMVFSEYLMDSVSARFDLKIKNVPIEIRQKSEQYAEFIAKQVKAWISKDNYAFVKSAAQYTIPISDSTWTITPPNYDKALEPNWKSLRYILLDSINQFFPPAPPTFNKDKNSLFYKYAKAVYDTNNLKNKEFQLLAKYWDDNPNEYFTTGHNTYFTHRINPPGHWLNITKEFCKKNNLNLHESSKIYAHVCLGIFDGIISCWNVKYTCQLIRPITYINRYIDPKWTPFIQTPPFPEYTSGHSVISGAASEILIHFFGDKPFEDSTIVRWGFDVRSFNSISNAAQEASRSRFYGGIHYEFGINEGLIQGRNIGRHVINKLDLLLKNNSNNENSK